jgi:hypothetical protein
VSLFVHPVASRLGHEGIAPGDDYPALLNLNDSDYDRDDHGPQDEARRAKGQDTTKDRKEHQKCV